MGTSRNVSPTSSTMSPEIHDLHHHHHYHQQFGQPHLRMVQQSIAIPSPSYQIHSIPPEPPWFIFMLGSLNPYWGVFNKYKQYQWNITISYNINIHWRMLTYQKVWTLIGNIFTKGGISWDPLRYLSHICQCNHKTSKPLGPSKPQGPSPLVSGAPGLPTAPPTPRVYDESFRPRRRTCCCWCR